MGLGLLCLVAAGSLVGSPVLAAKKAARHTVTCKQIKDAMDSGKSADDVAKDLKVSAARVKNCTMPPAKHGKKTAAHPS
jgi:hypothetical protein